jgi:orotate phosphoribosyltransferase
VVLNSAAFPWPQLLAKSPGIPTLFVRKTAKTYGTCRLAEGSDVTGKTITLIEDVITTGGAVLNAVQALRGEHASVSTVVCVINRNADPTADLSQASLSVRSVLTKADLDNIEAPVTG